MYKNIEVTVVGVAPLIVHNGQLANPLNQWSIDLAKVTSRRKKVEADHREMAHIEFNASLYYDDFEGPILPATVIEAVIKDGARKSRLGRQADAGIIVEKHARLEYDGPRDRKGLFALETFRFAVPVRVGPKKVVRTRPLFDRWHATFCIAYLEDVINERDLVTAISQAGMLCGIGDWRPRYGRFELQTRLK